MNAFHTHMPVELFVGEGVLSACGPKAASFGKRCLILTGAASAEKSRALADALDSMKQTGVEATVYPYIGSNPTWDQCRAAADALFMLRSQSILAIGGGSVMDAAKAVAVLATNHLPKSDALFKGGFSKRPLPLMLCGTTAGTGSEVSAVAVITDPNGQKRSVKHPFCYADCAFCDPRYTDSMPRAVTVSTALDALCHAVEGFLSPACDAVSAAFAAEALPRLMRGLTALCEQDVPASSQRDDLFYGSLLAGTVLNSCGTAYPHPLGYVLTEDHRIPHGQACAVFLPSLLDRAVQYTPDRARALFALCGGEDVLRRALSALTDVDATVTDEQWARYTVRFRDLPHYARVPGGFGGEDAMAVMRSLFSR